MSETEVTTKQPGRELAHTISYPITLDVISKKAADYLPLKIKGLLDKDGQAEVKAARLDVKKHRVAVENRRKEMKAVALEYGRGVDSAATVLKDGLSEIEDHLIAEEKTVTDEVARIAAEEEEKKQVTLQRRLDQLTALNYMVNPAAVEAMDDTQFAKTLSEASGRYQKQADEQRAEQRRQEAEEAKQKQATAEVNRQRKIQEDQLAADRKKLEEEKAEFEAKKAETDRINAETEAAIAKERQQAEAKRLEAERQVEVDRVAAVRRAAAEKQREEEVEFEKKRQKRLEMMRPDMDKLAMVVDALNGIRVPKVASADAQPKREQIVVVLADAIASIRKITSEK